MSEQENEQENEQEQETQDETPQAETPTFESWLEAQDATVKGLLDSHTRGLKSALESERTDRKALAKQVKELSDQAEAGSALKTQLDTLSTELESREAKANFYEDAHKNRVTNLRLAYIAATDAQLIDSRGNMDWNAFKTQFPEMIERPPSARGNAGAGTGANAPASVDMNALIRRAAGVNN